jgi:hypothetical protein
MTPFFIVTAVKTSNLTENTFQKLVRGGDAYSAGSLRKS